MSTSAFQPRCFFKMPALKLADGTPVVGLTHEIWETSEAKRTQRP